MHLGSAPPELAVLIFGVTVQRREHRVDQLGHASLLGLVVEPKTSRLHVRSASRMSREVPVLLVSALEALVQIRELAREPLRGQLREFLVMHGAERDHHAHPFAGREEVDHDCAFIRLDTR